jgi:hypothetical protein
MKILIYFGLISIAILFGYQANVFSQDEYPYKINVGLGMTAHVDNPKDFCKRDQPLAYSCKRGARVTITFPANQDGWLPFSNVKKRCVMQINLNTPIKEEKQGACEGVKIIDQKAYGGIIIIPGATQ